MRNRNCHNITKALIRSPFIIAAGASILVTGADILWLTGELLTHFGVFTESFYVLWRCFIMACLISGIIVCAIAIKGYLDNGYMRFEHKHELEYKKELQSQTKRDRIFK